ncbi:type I polyketide synthase [Streptomyces sp. BBFR2]|uniref:type I polyketide synthase n=1 Tax=Streptomyces sp. BBFR2 TaxID=3372854 RepID=UPI0037D9BC4D
MATKSGSGDLEPIAVVGMALRFPSAADSPEALWHLLTSGERTAGPVPRERWEPYLSDSPEVAGLLRRTVQYGSFLDDIAGFDANFFGIPPREAHVMDPQQRIALEVCWRALEHAGIPPRALAGSDTGVFMGVADSDYGRRLLSDIPGVDALRISGGMHYGVPNRISHLYDLLGPSISVDTACSSSMAAIHLAVRSLQSGEIPLALAGGSHLMIGPAPLLGLTDAGTTSPDGVSKPFDAAADGYGRGEGVGMLVLKRLADARHAGDRVLAVIAGSAVNQDGWTPGFMAPSDTAQAHMLRTLYERAGITPSAVDYVEAHGTGTAVGDPLEAAALGEVFGRGRTLDDPCLIGSVKPHIGHLESASGVAGVIKTVLAIRAGTIPATPGFSGALNPAVDWAASGLSVVREPMAWPDRGHPRRAGISSFGAGGTIGHLILEQAPEPAAPERAARHANALYPLSPAGADGTQRRTPRLFPFSSMSREGVAANASALKEWLDGHPEAPLPSVAHTLTRRRSALPWRGAVVAADHAQLADRLARAAEGGQAEGVALRRVRHEDADAVWVFSGQGAHWPAMGEQLLATEPVFAEVVDALAPVFQEELGIDPRSALTGGPLEDVAHVQALTFLMHTALAALWTSHGARPAAVVGHSLGEIAAAVAAGVLSREDGARLACRRARLMRAAQGKGAMALVGLAPDRIAAQLADDPAVSLAVYSSPVSAVISGDTSAVDRWCRRWEAEDVFVRRVKSDIASHSAHMDPMLSGIADAVRDLTVHEPSVPLYSTALDDPRSDAPRDGRYWQANLRNAVRFRQAVEAAAQDGHRVFLEISSHPIVTHSLTETVADGWDLDEFTVAHSLRRGTGPEAVVANLAELHCAGMRVDRSVPRYDGELTDLPGMVWQHTRYWCDTSLRRGGHDPEAHTLLGSVTALAGQATQYLWETLVDRHRRPYPNEHTVHGVDIVPAAVLINTFLNAAHHAGHPLALRDIALRTPIAVDPARNVQVTLGEGMLALHSCPSGTATPESWLTHTTACLDTSGGEQHHAAPRLRSPCDIPLDPARLLETLAPLGVAGFGFDWEVGDVRRGTHDIQARFRTPAPLVNPETDWAPLLDAAMTITTVLLLDEDGPRMPAHVRHVGVQGSPPAEFVVHARRTPDGGGIDIQVTGVDGTPVAVVGGLSFRALDGDGTGRLPDPRRITHHVVRRPWTPSGTREDPSHLIVVAPDGAVPPWLDKILTAAPLPYTLADSPDALTALIPAVGGRAAVVVAAATPDARQVGRAAEERTWSLLRTAQCLADLPPGHRPRLWCLTEDAATAHTLDGLAQAALLGAGRAVAGEHPELWGGHIDVADPAGLDDATLLSVLGDTADEDIYLIHGDGVGVARLAPLPETAPRLPAPCRPDGTYLITGGLGALGLETARRLAHRGARRLLLLGRTPLPPRATWGDEHPAVVRDRIDAIRRLEERGVTVHTAVADVADREATRRALADAMEHLPPVRGVVHAAGLSENRLIARFDAPALHRVLAPKTDGTLVLHELFPPGSLDFLVLFSSTGQLIRNTGQAGYAAANAFLDGFARYRRAQGCSGTLTLAWPGWQGLGLYATATGVFSQEMAASGTGDISAVTAFRCWEHAERSGVPYAAVLPLTAEPTGTPLALLRDLTALRASVPAPREEEHEATDWKTLPGAEQRAYLDHAVAQHLARELQMAPDEIDRRRPLLDMGLDSRMTLSLRVHLEKTLDIKLPATLLWRYPTLHDVLTYLQQTQAAAEVTT